MKPTCSINLLKYNNEMLKKKKPNLTYLMITKTKCDLLLPLDTKYPARQLNIYWIVNELDHELITRVYNSIVLERQNQLKVMDLDHLHTDGNSSMEQMIPLKRVKRRGTWMPH
jgi:hypothetical protein